VMFRVSAYWKATIVYKLPAGVGAELGLEAKGKLANWMLLYITFILPVVEFEVGHE